LAQGSGEAKLLDPEGLGGLIGLLRERGYVPLGPTVQDGAVVYDVLESADDLPVGVTDRQEAGRYRLEARSDGARFGYNLGPRSWKHWLFPPRLRLFAARRAGRGFAVEDEPGPPPRYAFFGIRACEIAAIEVQDRVLRNGAAVDAHYAAVRESALLVAVNCGQAAATCFCTSFETGPRATSGFDLALTELLGDDEHVLLCEAGSERGTELLAALDGKPAEPPHHARAAEATARAEADITRHLETEDLPARLEAALEHPRWDDVAGRCLSCGNCTMVCPTCFCHTVHDVNDLAGERTERIREWDSCFTGGHAYIHGGNLRPSVRARYRQWLTHKLGTWQEQFGTSGCVGCGRCVAWCPVGIDITEEIAALTATSPGPSAAEDE